MLDLAGELAEHLREPGRRARGRATGWRPAPPAAARQAARRRAARSSTASGPGSSCCRWWPAYAAAKAAREVIDYGDQMALAARIAPRHPEVGAGERGRYQVVLLDEYQDTSHAQLVLLRALFGGGHPVTAVGDPCQSIYGWRGASAGNLRRFATDFPSRGRRPGPGPRCCPPASATPAGSWTPPRLIQAPLRAEAPEVPRLVAPPGAGRARPVTCALLETAADEAAWVADQVARAAGAAARPGAPRRRALAGRRPRRTACTPSDIAVLCRKRAQFPALRAALEAAGIPVEVVGLGGLLTVPEVQDIVATLRVLHDPGAADALARLLTGPGGGSARVTWSRSGAGPGRWPATPAGPPSGARPARPTP